MKKFSSEIGQHYDSYTFGYAQYAEREAGDSLTIIYDSGFLPYSGSPDVKNIFYMARSARVALNSWHMDSENRRIAKKFDSVFQKRRLPIAEFTADTDFYAFCLAYFKTLHGEHAMPRERLEHILSCGLVSDIMIYHNVDGKPAAYVLETGGPAMRHFWFSFYDPAYAKQSLGLWLMLDCIRDAKAVGITHHYLGTVYGAKALYKTNFAPLEWWDGGGWNRDSAKLKELGRSDDARTLPLADEWKEERKLF